MIAGKRVVLRDLAPGSVNRDYLRWVRDAEVNRYLEVRLARHTLASLRKYVRNLDPRRDRMFGIVVRDTDRHIGNIKLGGMNPHHRFAELGLMIGDKSMWGKGYGTEAIGLATRLGFQELKLNKIYAGMYAGNGGSLNAFLSNGYREIGRQKRHFFCDHLDRFVDCILVEKLNPKRR